MNYEDYLIHFNPNHDPNTGRFASSSLGLSNLKNAKTSNLDKWGRSPDQNVLYIAGYSGSGKSTTALSLARKNDTVIHLDGYSEPDAMVDGLRNDKFNKYLDEHVPKWKMMSNATEDGSKGTMERHSKEYLDVVEDFFQAIQSFGREQYKSGNRVVVEGVQIADDWLAGDKSFYKGKPMIVLTTNPVTSMKRAFERDDRGNIVKGLMSLDSSMEYIKWYARSYNSLNQLAKAASAKRGQQYINDILKTYGQVKL